LTNSALLSVAVDSVVLLLLPQPATIAANAMTAPMSAMSLKFKSAPLAGLDGA
jgi:hypothetical protein